jgi:hypothetical protein
MIYMVPVVRYLGFNQTSRQTPKGLGANHPKYRTTVSLRGLIIRMSAFRKKHDVLWRYCVQHLSRIHLYLADIVDYFWDAVLVSISGPGGLRTSSGGLSWKAVAPVARSSVYRRDL